MMPGKNILSIIIGIIFIAANINEGCGARILGFFPFPAKSHHRVFQPLLRALSQRGHQVTYFTSIPMDKPPPDLNQIITEDYFLNIIEPYEKLPKVLKDWIPTAMGTFTVAQAEFVLQNDVFKGLIQSSSEFDLILHEFTVLHEPFSPLVHRFNCPSVEVLPSGNLHWTWFLHGNPYDTSYIIDTSVMYTDHMSLWERVHNTFNSLAHRFIVHHCYLPKYQRIADQYFRYPGWESRPPIATLMSNASIVLVNSHSSLNYPYPQSPNFKDIGGINLQPETKSLSKELKDFIDGATDGVIYFTLGSHAQVSTTLNENLRAVFTQAFSKLKQRVLWKWENEFPNLPSNIKIAKWFPQQEILAHKNMKLFITHGGFLSLTESVYNGVPMIAIPLMGDQYKNTKHMEHLGYGVPLLFDNITEPSLSWAINHVLNNPKFAENAKQRSRMFRDKPETALETAVYWTEYVIRHKGAHHLRPAIATMPWYQQAMIDVYGALLLITIIPLILLYLIIRQMFRCVCWCFGSSSSKKDKRKRE